MSSRLKKWLGFVRQREETLAEYCEAKAKLQILSQTFFTQTKNKA